MGRMLIVCLIAIWVAGCTIGPDYRRPAVVTPAAWRVDYESAAGLANLAWWEQFNDPDLSGLIAAALRQNLDLMTAAKRVEQFLGVLDTTRSEFFPQVGTAVSGGRQRETGNGPLPREAITYDFYEAQLNFTWEIDLWGRIRRASEAARAEVLASEEGRRGVVLTLVTSVAGSYITLRGLDRQLAIARETERAYAKTLDLFKLRHEKGTVSRVEVSQVESQYEIAAQEIPQLEALIRQQENLLSILLGRYPGPIPRGLTLDEMALPGIPAGLPSELLENRPDIRQAEATMVAANARIGVARALYFPRLALTGDYGVASIELGDLFDASSEIWSLAGQAVAPIFTFGSISGQVKQAEAIQQQALLQYRQTILNAFGEVENALIRTTKGREQLASQRRQVAALQDYARLATLQYEAGTADYLKVLDAERSLFSGQLSMVSTQTDVFTSLVDVYRAMGGGWIDEADRMAATAEGNDQKDLP
ncbi:MAG: efflux transporter outer membrane subunit [Syntrophotaleaceae bacterium]